MRCLQDHDWEHFKNNVVTSGGQGQEASPQAVAPTPKGQAASRSQVYLSDTDEELDCLLFPSKTTLAPHSADHAGVMAGTAFDWSPFPEALLDLTDSRSPFGPTEASQDVTLEHLQELLDVLRGPEIPSPLTGFLNPLPSSASQLLAPSCTRHPNRHRHSYVSGNKAPECLAA